MGAITGKLKEEMNPALFAFGREAVRSAFILNEAASIISDISLLSIEEAQDLALMFRREYDTATQHEKSAVVCNMFHELWTLCKAVAEDGLAAVLAGREKGGR